MYIKSSENTLPNKKIRMSQELFNYDINNNDNNNDSTISNINQVLDIKALNLFSRQYAALG